ncbi:hypothetical protein Bequi_13380 [Brachybacterium sp. JHP9]|uniref:Uncharacterized protein n=1 Tax=Brachybacterium equifaecis TaxID=2910770 RepID=A0ABT0R395_9MICO|nr:hypothetical protein [Brachybacterium equifaecis]MCL6424356.1 hypothetical protein [Brachybacterium equifaecis]
MPTDDFDKVDSDDLPSMDETAGAGESVSDLTDPPSTSAEEAARTPSVPAPRRAPRVRARTSRSGYAADVAADDHVSKLLAQTLQDRKQRFDQRASVFRWVMRIVPSSLVATIALVAWLAVHGKVGDAVYIAFISAMAAQSFALILTLVTSLYRSEQQAAAKAEKTPK